MDNENVNAVVTHAMSDDSFEMRSALYNAIQDKIFDALEQRKIQIAANLIAQTETQ
jgi:hypothetical protein